MTQVSQKMEQLLVESLLKSSKTVPPTYKAFDLKQIHRLFEKEYNIEYID